MLSFVDRKMKDYALAKYGDRVNQYTDAEIEEARVFAFNESARLSNLFIAGKANARPEKGFIEETFCLRLLGKERR